MKTTVNFTSHTDYSGLTNYPESGTQTISFNATDCNIYTYVEQFRCFLRACGFSEKNITDALGEF